MGRQIYIHSEKWWLKYPINIYGLSYTATLHTKNLFRMYGNANLAMKVRDAVLPGWLAPTPPVDAAKATKGLPTSRPIFTSLTHFA